MLAWVAIGVVWLIAIVILLVTFDECIEEAQTKKEVYIYIGLLIFSIIFGPFALLFFYLVKLGMLVRTKLEEFRE